MISFFKKEQPNNDPKSLKEAVLAIHRLEKRIQNMEEELRGYRQDLEKTVGKVAMVRYNPFREVGSDQSFSIAFLNSLEEGVVLTSHYGRDMTRMYAKQIRGGASPHPLSVEEQNVVDMALGREPKEVAKEKKHKRV
ncbi:MAG: DUF4446 family protein [bacterium]|nr:DUF4446 family protein [bacterium]